jgi:SAM-dependent methyltransferase
MDKKEIDKIMTGKMTWEQSVAWLRQQPDHQELVRACYLDDPLLETAERFRRSAEWQAVQELLPARPGIALDIGAGRGISSYALAKLGWQVTALEPDHSELVGAQAIRNLARESGLPISVCEEFGENQPFETGSFDLVYLREVLHHACALVEMCQEAGRVLGPGGVFLATREHVVSDGIQKAFFLQNHDLHRFFGGENAYRLEEYLSAISSSGLLIQQVCGPLDSMIHSYPREVEADESFRYYIRKRRLWNWRKKVVHLLPESIARKIFPVLDSPGRMYSFLAVKQ